MKKQLFILITGAYSIFAQAQQNRITFGGDISMLPEYERVNTPYYDNSGNKINTFSYLQNTVNMNSMRVRLFVSPKESTNSKTGVCQDLDYVTKLGKRIKDAGMDFLLDFHYSDSWADPAQQSIPASWYTGALSNSNPSDKSLEDRIYTYTKECLTHLVNNGAMPDYIQIGNEISYGMLWRGDNDKCYTSQSTESTQWRRFTSFLNSAAKAVREVTPEAKIVIHIERSGQSSVAKEFFSRMNHHKVDYDIIGLSYYPFYHGELSALKTTLNTLESSFPDKSVQIVETSYFYQYFASDAKYNTQSTWAASSTGQQKFVSDLCTELAKHKNVNGLYYWFPEENGNGGASWSASNVVLTTWLNRGLWDNNNHKALPALLTLKDFLTKQAAVGIESVEANSPSRTGIYTITGQRLDIEPSKGVYIKNGKKVYK